MKMIEKRSELIEEVVKYIDKKCFMRSDQREIWTHLKSELSGLCFSVEEEIEGIIPILDRIICKLGDPHTRIYNVGKREWINPAPLQWIQDNLFVIDNRIKKVTHLNGVEIGEILTRYKNYYPAMSKQVIYNQILQDVKFRENLFNINELKVRDKEGEKSYYAQDVDKIRKKAGDSLKRKFGGVILHKVDQDTMLVKILSFGNADLEKMFLSKMNEVSESIKNIIFDIRDNNGGDIQIAKKIASYVIGSDVEYDYDIGIKQGIFVESYVASRQLGTLKNKKIVVFVNRNTMSASEYIFLKAIKLNNPNVIVIGEETFGLSGQASVNYLTDTIALYITEKRYYVKSHKAEITNGILPDYNIDIEEIGEGDWYLDWFEKNKKVVVG